MFVLSAVKSERFKQLFAVIFRVHFAHFECEPMQIVKLEPLKKKSLYSK